MTTLTPEATTTPTPQPKLTHTPNFQLTEATPRDIPEISTVFFTCFSDPFLKQMFPWIPPVQKWWDDANLHDLLHRDSDRYVVVRDLAAPSDSEGKAAVGDGKVVAYAKWLIPSNETTESSQEFFPRFPKWADECDKGLCDLFFNHIERDRLGYFEKRDLKQHCYLDMLATLPEYRKLGIGGMLVDWGCKIADEKGRVAYVDASDMGGPVYKRFGFVSLEPSPVPGADFSCTAYVREPVAV